MIAIPVYNEARHVLKVLSAVLAHHRSVLVVDDGSTDATPDLLNGLPVDVIRHARNRGYGRSLRDAFAYASDEGYDWIITMDCDFQHEPGAIPEFLAASARGDADIVSGSRYIGSLDGEGEAPRDRVAINRLITDEINERLATSIGVRLTDSFCGFKACRVSALDRMRLTEDGYAFPMQFWAQAAALRLRVLELPVRRIYNDPKRAFGNGLDDPEVRLSHYRAVLHAELLRVADRLPGRAVKRVVAPDSAALRAPSQDVSHLRRAGSRTWQPLKSGAGALRECCGTSR
ncbi:MAG TPA: glycosyltransferase family 2 protein [Phycisphaerales bacterium]|nr:glycosyltransferase family 2 protein [Phycisphaerales bacterium]